MPVGLPLPPAEATGVDNAGHFFAKALRQKKNYEATKGFSLLTGGYLREFLNNQL